jgi:hypothetical protein
MIYTSCISENYEGRETKKLILEERYTRERIARMSEWFAKIDERFTEIDDRLEALLKALDAHVKASTTHHQEIIRKSTEH